MTQLRTALYTTVFPNAIPFLSAFSRSIDAQSDNDFDLWVSLDRLTVEEVEPLLGNGIQPQWVGSHDAADSPATIRQRAWEQIVQHYDRVIFVDSDDVLGPERVAQAKRGLSQADVYACALDLINENGTRYGKAFRAGDVQDWKVFLASRNVFGLSNTAYRSDVLRNCLPLAETTALIDWHLINRAIHMDAKLLFDNSCHMSYRIYAASMARVLPPFDVDYIRYATDVVLRHYDVLRPYIATDHQHTQQIDDQRKNVALFASLSLPLLEEYVRRLNTNGSSIYLWWDCVAHKELKWLWMS